MKKTEGNEFGIYGLGTMGRNLLLNMADHGFAVAGGNRSDEKVRLLREESQDMDNVQAFEDMADFVNSLARPRNLMILVTAGDAVDKVIAELLPFLDKNDLIIDGGNSHFTDTARRHNELEAKGIRYVGLGISGGEEGARRGPSLMPGGDKEAYERVKPILEKVAAQVDGYPTVAYLGPGAAGHFVKMVHNGIEYAIMQLIAECYETMKNGLGMDNKAIHTTFEKWNNGRLQSYLLEVTRDVFAYINPDTGRLLLDDIKDQAKSKGTGKWTSQTAKELNLPSPIIDIAVSMRDLSKYKSLRSQAAKLYGDDADKLLSDQPEDYLPNLERAFHFGMVTAYAQGMHLLHRASGEYNFDLPMAEIAKLWRGGCIIRAAFLEDVYQAFLKNNNLEHLFLDESVAPTLKVSVPGLRRVVADAARHGLALPAFASALGYFDAFRSENLPTNLIQAQRDYFGAHTYELVGKEGTFHTEWQQEAEL